MMRLLCLQASELISLRYEYDTIESENPPKPMRMIPMYSSG